MEITQYPIPQEQYIFEETSKKQIFLHHTAGNQDPYGVYKDWNNNPERIATCVVIGGKPKKTDIHIDGQIIQGYSSKYWAYHLGLKESTFHNFNLPYKSLDKYAIGLEICSWGQLTYKNNKFYNFIGKAVANEEVIELDTPFRGYKYFHNYTDAQIQSVKELLLYWKNKYNIPLTYNKDIFDVNARALKGESGVFTHCSVRYDKVDIYPHPKLIEMLKTL